MDRFEGLDSLMASKGIRDARTFEAYLKAVFTKRENQNANLTGFVFDTPQLDFTYEMLEAERLIEVMASYVDLNSPVLPSGSSVKIEKLSGTIPRMKHATGLGENDYRKLMVSLNEVKSVARFSNVSETVAVQRFLSEQLFKKIDEIVAAFKNSLNYQVGQMKSAAQLTLTDANNPRGSIRATFTAHVPEANFIDKTWWTATSAGVETATGEPVEDIREIVRGERWRAGGYDAVTVELNEKFLAKLLQHPAVLKAVGYALTGIGLRYTKANDDNAVAVAKGATYEAQKEAFRRLVEADELLLSKTVCGVETLNTTTLRYERKAVDAFEQYVVLVRPSGNVGVIKNVAPLRPDARAVYGGVYGGRGLIEYTYNADTREQHWKGELTALAVLSRPRDMKYIRCGVKTVATPPAGGDGGGNG